MFHWFCLLAVALGLYLAALLFAIGVGSLADSWMAEQRFSFTSFTSGWLTIAASWFPFMSLCLMAAWFNQWFRKGNVALTVSMMIYFCMKALPWVMPSAAAFLPTSYLDWWNSGSLAQALSSFIYLISSGMLFFLLGYAMFRTKEY